MSVHCVMIGDIVGSRELEDWKKVYDKMDKALTIVNHQMDSDVLLEFMPTPRSGDEFLGILKTPVQVFNAYKILKWQMSVNIRCGFGIGEVEKPFDHDSGMRGTAFENARLALDRCKKEDRYLLIMSDPPENDMDRTLNTLFLVLQSFERSWTARQRDVIEFYMSHSDFTYEEIGMNFTITKQGVSQILKRAKWDVMNEVESLVHDILREYSINPEDVNPHRFTSESKPYKVYNGGSNDE